VLLSTNDVACGVTCIHLSVGILRLCQSDILGLEPLEPWQGLDLSQTVLPFNVTVAPRFGAPFALLLACEQQATEFSTVAQWRLRVWFDERVCVGLAAACSCLWYDDRQCSSCLCTALVPALWFRTSSGAADQSAAFHMGLGPQALLGDDHTTRPI
jgi:hypothetical protein